MNLRPLTADDMDALTELAHVCDETYLAWTQPGWVVRQPARNAASVNA